MIDARKPHQVFTPRAANVNDEMYIRRENIERRLKNSLHTDKFLVIHGESGNGKTWLYKRVFQQNSVPFVVLNLSNVIGAGSLDDAFQQKLAEYGYSSITSTESHLSGGAKILGVGGNISSKTARSFVSGSPFLNLIEELSRRANGKNSVLVLDNFESIVHDSAVLDQVRALIINSDDPTFAQHKVQILIVGVPGNLKEAISKGNNATPVSNRLTELPEVDRMTEAEARELIQRGFEDELQLKLSPDVNKDDLYKSIFWHTDRIAQHLHELCLIVAQEATDSSGVITPRLVEEALSIWASDTLSSDLAVIEGVMNARDTKAGRKNQVLYAMGVCKLEDFKYSDIEPIVRENFDVGGATLNVPAILSGFSTAKNPLIRRTPSDAWRFVSPKYKMAIRAKLIKGQDGRVSTRR